MKKSTKILIGLAVGAGVAYLLHKRSKNKSGTSSTNQLTNNTDIRSAVNDVLEAKLNSRDEQIAYILQNTEANFKEETSGFEGVEYVWNQNLGKFYPKGTLTETKAPEYFDSVFLSADGSKTDDPTDKAEEILSKLNDKEIQLAYNIVKYRKNNPRSISEEQAFIEIGGKDPKVIEVIKTKISPKLNDIKAIKKSPNWNEKWEMKIKKFTSLFDKAQKCGKKPSDKRNLDSWMNCLKSKDSTPENNREMMEFVNSQCGNKPRGGRKLEMYKKCVQDSKRKYNQNMIQSSDVKTKELFKEDRQNEFARQVSNRQDGAIFAGKRWDGRSNKQEEYLVREGL